MPSTNMSDLLTAKSLASHAINNPEARHEYFDFLKSMREKHGPEYSTMIHQYSSKLIQKDAKPVTESVYSDKKPRLTGLSFNDLERLSESAGANFHKFNQALLKNLNLPSWTNTIETYGVYLRKLNEHKRNKLVEGQQSDVEKSLFTELTNRADNSINSASVGDFVSLLHLATLNIPGHKIVAKLNGFLVPKEITKITNNGSTQQLEFADGSRYPEKDGGDIFQQTQGWNMTKLFPSEETASKAYTFYALIGKKMSAELDFDIAVTRGNIDETIVQTGGEYELKSSKGKNLGKFPTKAGAKKHEQEVNYFKHKDDVNEAKVEDLNVISPADFVIKANGDAAIIASKEPRGQATTAIKRAVYIARKKQGVTSVRTQAGKDLNDYANMSKFMATKFTITTSGDAEQIANAIVNDAIITVNDELSRRQQSKAGAPTRNAAASKSNAVYNKSKNAEVGAKLGLTPKDMARVTAKQVGGDDGYQYNVFIDGRSMISGLTRSEVPHYKMQAYKAIAKQKGALDESTEETNPTDTITVDIPLMIRLMEYAKEDAADDMALHQVAEKLTTLSQEGRTLTMSDYDAICNTDNTQGI